MAALAFPGPGGAAPRFWEPRLVPAAPTIGRSARGRPGSSRGVSAATYRRRRLLVAGAAVGVLLTIHVVVGVVTNVALAVLAPAASSAAQAVAAPAPMAQAAQRTHVVQPGDTIWGVARRFQPEGDVRPLVDAMVDARQGRSLQVGERLAVP